MNSLDVYRRDADNLQKLGAQCRVLDLDTLIRTEKLAGRPKDPM